jgi:uncharacterized protein YjbJ (UPF0337 family)
MSIIDKITGRTKQAVADLKGDESLHREGVQEERKGKAKEDLARQEARAEAAEAEAERKRAEVDAMEQRTEEYPAR